MGAQTDTAMAFCARLETLPGAPPIVWENITKEPEQGTTWLRAFHIPAGSGSAALGASSPVRYDGIFQIDVVSPSNSGAMNASRLVDSIVSLFKIGTKIDTTSGRINIFQTDPESGFRSNDWYVRPVSVYYRIDAPNI